MSDRTTDFAALLERLTPELHDIIARYEEKRSALLMLAHVFQRHEGFISAQAVRALADLAGITPAETEATLSFYTLLYRKPVGKYMLQPCRGLACAINGADDVMAYFRKTLGVGNLQTTPDGMFSYEEVECLAACDRAVCMQVNLEFAYDLTPEKIDAMLAAMRAGTYGVAPLPQTQPPEETWHVRPGDQIATGQKSAGAIGVESADNAGGLGDRSGAIMLDNIVAQDVNFFGRTRERAVVDSRAIAAVTPEAQNGDRAGH